jgi:putative hydrolase of the HAD superfamily
VAVRGLRTAAILLDALGTLVELEPPAPRLRAELRQRFGLEVSHAQADRALRAEISYYRTHLVQGRDEPGLVGLRARCAQALAAELETGLGQNVPRGEAMVDALLASLRFRAFPDAPDALARLRELDIRLVVVSNWDVSLPDVLGRAGLSRWLDGVITSAEVGVGKPDPAPFRRGLALAGVVPEQAWHVGDSPYEDVQGARAVGVEPVLISRGTRTAKSRADPVRSISTLAELPGLVSAADG